MQKEHSPRISLKVRDGIVVVGSDGHYWPGKPSTAHRALVHFVRKMAPKVVVMNGDAFDGASISRHPPIGWENRPTVAQELAVCQERLGEISGAASGAKKIWTLGNHDCFDSKTECFTRRGWLHHSDILPTDMVLSLDGTVAAWSPINEILSGQYSGDLIRIEKTRMSMAVTPNHRVFLNRQNWRTGQFDIREYRNANDLPCAFNIPVAGQTIENGASLTDDQIALAGWLLTDGHFGKYNISLFQSKVSGIDEIKGLLSRLNLDYSEYRRQRERRSILGRKLLKDPLPSVHFHLSAASSKIVWEWLPEKKTLPSWVDNLNSRQFQVLLDALVAGDGVWDGHNSTAKTCCVLYGQEAILSDVQSLALRHGWRARLVIDNRGDYRLCLAREPKIRIDRSQVFKENYNGTAWCLRVPLGNFMVRRNGCAYFSGNSRYETRLATVASEYSKVPGLHLQDHFPDWKPCWSVWLNNNVVVKHRYKGGTHATHNNTVSAGKTIITGHLHSAKVTPFTDYNGTRYGVDTGCIADPWGPQFVDYSEDNSKSWVSGFCVLTFIGGKLLMPELVTVWSKDIVQFRGELIKV